MRSPGVLLSILLLACAGCGGGSSSADAAPDAPGAPDASAIDATPPDASTPDVALPPDARVYDFSCAGAPDPTTAPTTLTVSGMVVDLLSTSALNNVTVESRLRSDPMNVLASDTTDTTGAFSVSVANPGAMPVDAFLQFSLPSYATTYIYPSDPIAGDSTIDEAGMIMSSNVLVIYSVSGAMALVPGNGTSLVVVMDCLGQSIEGATVGLSPTAAETQIGYLDGMMPSLSATATDASGVAVGFNVPAGDITVTADYMGTPLEAHTYGSHDGGVSLTIIHP
jgi:hypothetical protein